MFGAVTSNIASAVTLLVTDCGDGSSQGTLRNTIFAAPDNSVVQIPLACSTITLDQGAIHIPTSITNLYIVGQSPSATIISRSSLPSTVGRLFEGKQSGTLGFSQLTLTGGAYAGSQNPFGGCVYSQSNVALNHAVVTYCSVSPIDGTRPTRGGGIFASGSVALFDSRVTNNTVIGARGVASIGGGIFASGEIDVTGSTISGNQAINGRYGSISSGGGFYSDSYGNVVIKNSTVSANSADFSSAGGVRMGSYTLSITNSTIANNFAYRAFTISSYEPMTVTDSTVAFNTAGLGGPDAPVGVYTTSPLEMNNSIMANNLAETGTSFDVYASVASHQITGSNNLITATANLVPTGTLTACPRLGHLSDNGGLTQTVPLLAGSPALDVGAANGQATDQRGTGYPRKVGTGTDIGAYERQVGAMDDVVFLTQFESRCN
jgi:hypothetical protein